MRFFLLLQSGELFEYTSKNMADGMRTEDVSRIAYQLLSALDHCGRHNILHRDIKVRFELTFKIDSRPRLLTSCIFSISNTAPEYNVR